MADVEYKDTTDVVWKNTTDVEWTKAAIAAIVALLRRRGRA